MTCYLVRHGKDDDTVRGGWSEQPLSDEGKAQAEALACLVQNRDLGIQCIRYAMRYSENLIPVSFRKIRPRYLLLMWKLSAMPVSVWGVR